MSGIYSRPRWGWLYPILPLSVGSLWLIDHLHLSVAGSHALSVTALVIIGGYAEVWRRANAVALLHEASCDGAEMPLYCAREAVPARRAQPEWEMGTSSSVSPSFAFVSRRERVAEPSAAVFASSSGDREK